MKKIKFNELEGLPQSKKVMFAGSKIHKAILELEPGDGLHLTQDEWLWLTPPYRLIFGNCQDIISTLDITVHRKDGSITIYKKQK